MSQAPRHLIPIPPTRDPEHLVRVINQRLRDLQGLVNELTSARTQALDMGGQRVMNAGRAKVDTDLVTRKDLLDYAIFSPEGDTAISDKPLVARGGLRVPKKARMKDEVVTLEDLYNFLGIMQATGMLSGDVNGQFNNNVLNDTGVVPGTYGDGTHVGQFTVNSQGRLTFAQDVMITAGGGGGSGAPLYETFTGPGASVTLSVVPVALFAFKNGVEQHNDGVGTTEGNYKISGSTLTTPLAAGDRLDVYEWVAGGGPVYETFTGPASFVTLGMSPSILIAEKNGVQQHNDGAGTTEGNYKLAGNVLTTPLAAGDVLDVFEWS